MERLKRKGWYERLDVPKITLDWVKMNCKVTDRENKLLQIVNYRKLVRRDHLEIIHPNYRDIVNRTSVLNRSIKKLFEKHCLDKVHEETFYAEGNKPCIVALDRAGAILLNIPFKRRIRQYKHMLGNEERVFRVLPSNFLHVHGVNQLEVETIIFCIENNQCEIIRWDLEQDNARRFTYGEKYTIIPDIFMIMRNGNKPYLLFIEYDTGSENFRYTSSFPVLLEKLEKYQKYKLSGAWQSEWWMSKIRSPFPLILFVTEDQKRIAYIKEKGKGLGLKVDVCKSEDYKEKLKEIVL